MTVAVLGLILLVAAGVLTAAVVTSNTGAIETDLWGATVSNISLGAVFVAGMLTTVVAVAGLLLLLAGARRGRRLQHERRVLRRENQRLARQQAEPEPAEGGWRRPAEPDATPGPAATTVEPTRGPEGNTVHSPTPPAGSPTPPARDVDPPIRDGRDRTTSDANR